MPGPKRIYTEFTTRNPHPSLATMAPQQYPRLETSSHLLQFFPGTTASYYTLAEKARPTVYTPIKLAPDAQLSIDPLASSDGEPSLLVIRLHGQAIGEISATDDEEVDKLAQFTAQWREELSALADSVPEPEQGLNFNPITAVASGLTALPKLFNGPPPSSTPSSKSTKSRSDSVALPPAPSPTTSVTPAAPAVHLIDQIYAQRDEFLVEKLLRFRLVTWNMHGEPIQRANIANLLGLPVLYDVYLIALQESDLLGPTNLYANTTTLQNTKDAIVATLGGPDSFQIVGHNQLLGMMLILVAATPIASQLSNPRIATTGTGLFGVWGNKGAASIRVTLGADPSVGVQGTELAFVNCHLAAGEGKAGVERRKWELGEIEKKLLIPGLVGTNPRPEILFSGQEDTIIDDITDNLPPSANEEDDALIFLLGDLNYRVALDPDVVIEFVNRKDYDTILNHDQLMQQRRERKVLTGYKEMPITFQPTYKFGVGTDHYDDNKSGNSETARAPSYTDRIFAKPSASLYQTEYGSLMEYTISDHKPVYAAFELMTFLIDPARRKTVVDKVLRQSDNLENSARPNLTVTPMELQVTDAIVLREAHGHVVIEQAGTAGDRVIEWEIDIESADIHVEPKSGHLPAGAKQYIHFTCTLPVAPHTGSSLAQGVAILRILDAQDIFIPVEFRALPTCLGASLDVLSRMPHGARQQGGIMAESSTNMPREIWNCVDYLWGHIVPDMFSPAGAKQAEESVQQQVQDWMDLGEDFDHAVLDAANAVRENAGVYSVAAQFLMFLKNLDGGIVPAEYYSVVLRGKEGSTLVS